MSANVVVAIPSVVVSEALDVEEDKALSTVVVAIPSVVVSKALDVGVDKRVSIVVGLSGVEVRIDSVVVEGDSVVPEESPTRHDIITK